MKENKFDVNGVGVANGNYFGLPFVADDAALVLMSVPWDATASYGGGAAEAPDAIIAASTQLDFYDPATDNAWRRGIATLPVDEKLRRMSRRSRRDAQRVICALEAGKEPLRGFVDRVNGASREVNRRVYEQAKAWLERGKRVGLVGGDHSTPYGLISALGEREEVFSVLHIDAHADLREAYEGFEFSHASIMFNVLRDVPAVEKLVQVGVRDQSEQEAMFAKNDPRVVQFDDWALMSGEFTGRTWDAQCEEIIANLGERVYVSFDIDGLSPEFAPGTGTPVPGGGSFNRAMWLLWRITNSGRRVIGFDLCEVAPRGKASSRRETDEWDANVGARVLWRLCGSTLVD